MIINNLAGFNTFNEFDDRFDDERLRPIINLEDDEKDFFFKVLQLAIKNVVTDRILKKRDIELYTIGKVKIKDINKIALKHKNEIANNLGYNNFRQVPKDKLDYLQQEANKRTISDIKTARKKKSKIRGKIFKINLNKP